jgi:hypothetical protein
MLRLLLLLLRPQAIWFGGRCPQQAVQRLPVAEALWWRQVRGCCCAGRSVSLLLLIARWVSAAAAGAALLRC